MTESNPPQSGATLPASGSATVVLDAASPRLSSLQSLRGVAAVAVVASHAARHVDRAVGAPVLATLFQPGHTGVDLFFVISGFVILVAHGRDIGRPERVGRYVRRRFDRIMPLYWIALALTVAPAMLTDRARPSWGAFAWSASLLPAEKPPLLGIAWTLQFEVVFYAAFAALLLHRRFGILVFATWGAAIVASMSGVLHRHLPPPFGAIYGTEFMMGMVAAHLFATGRVGRPLAASALGAGLFVAAMVVESLGVADGFAWWWRLVYGPAAALLIAGLAAAEQTRGLRVPAWLQALGGASYAIYLFQFVFIGAVWQVWHRTMPGGADHSALCFAILAAAAISGGLAASRLIEQPLLRLARRRRRPRQDARTTAPA